MNELKEYFIKKGGKELNGYIELNISTCKGDRFKSWLELYDDEPNKIYIFRSQLSGFTQVSHNRIIDNHNNLHSTFKTDYETFIKELKDNNIEFEVA